MHINDLLRKLEMELLDSGRRMDGERIAQVATRLAHSQDVTKALESLYGVRGWDGVAVRLMWYLDQMRRSAMGNDPGEDLARFQMAQLLEALPVSAGGRGKERPVREPQADLREALFRFGSVLEQLRRASFADGRFHGLPADQLDRVIAEAALLRAAASAQHSRDVARFARAFTFFATYVRDHEMLGDPRVLQVIGTANLTLQTVLETTEAEDFDSLYQTIALLENPRTLLQVQDH